MPIKRNLPSKSATGYKPSVAFGNEEAAKQNIDQKISFLTDVCAARSNHLAAQKLAVGSLSKVLTEFADEDFLALTLSLPDSKRKFNAFECADLPAKLRVLVPAFRSNSAETLRKDSERTAAVERVVRLVSECREADKPSSQKAEKVAALKRQLTIEIQLRKIAEENIYAQKNIIKRLEEKVISSDNRYAALHRQCEETTESLRREIRELRVRGSATASETALAVVPLRPRRQRKLT